MADRVHHDTAIKNGLHLLKFNSFNLKNKMVNLHIIH